MFAKLYALFVGKSKLVLQDISDTKPKVIKKKPTVKKATTRTVAKKTTIQKK